jgi:hypothetical protein
MVSTKHCIKCGEAKPPAEYYAHPRMADGRLNKCKACSQKEARAHRIENADRVRGYDRLRSKAPHRKAARPSRTPEQRRAHHAVQSAVKRGQLEKRPCAFCGTAEKLEAHHHDYGKPLDVTWLCAPCHHRFHALERMATYGLTHHHLKEL